MPIRIDSFPVPDPHSIVRPDTVTISLPLHSTGNSNTFALFTYSIDPSNDTFFAVAGGVAKSVVMGPSIIPVPPGVVNDDALPLVRGAGAPMVVVTIGVSIQECDPTGIPIDAPQHRNTAVQVA